MDIEKRCINCDGYSDCFDSTDYSTDCDGGFEPRKDLVELHRIIEEKQGKLRKAVDAIEKHKIDLVTTEDNAKIYMRAYPSCATTKLWKTLEEIR